MVESNTHKEFMTELKALLAKYNAVLSTEDHYPGYAECGEDVRISVEFSDYRISDIDLGSHFK